MVEKAIVTVQTVAMHILLSNCCSQLFAISNSCLAARDLLSAAIHTLLQRNLDTVSEDIASIGEHGE